MGMNIRFYNAKMLLPGQGHGFEIKEGELWVKGQPFDAGI